MKAGPCLDGPLNGKSVVIDGIRFVVPVFQGYNKNGQAVHGEYWYAWSNERNGWVSG